MQRFVHTPTLAALVLLGVAAVLLSNLLPAGGVVAQDQPPSLAARSATSPFVDVHTHPDSSQPERSVQAALEAMKLENAAKIVFMPPPFTADDPGRYDAETLLPAVKGHADKLVVLGGGGSLNAMIQQSARSGDAGPEIQRKFKQRAEELLRLGAVGFGELTAEHFQGATPYQSVSPDHPLFLLLADIAAEHGVPTVENKPVARLLFAMGRVGEPIPPELYQAIAEILAFVYRTHRYYFHRLKSRRLEAAALTA